MMVKINKGMWFRFFVKKGLMFILKEMVFVFGMENKGLIVK